MEEIGREISYWRTCCSVEEAGEDQLQYPTIHSVQNPTSYSIWDTQSTASRTPQLCVTGKSSIYLNWIEFNILFLKIGKDFPKYSMEIETGDSFANFLFILLYYAMIPLILPYKHFIFFGQWVFLFCFVCTQISQFNVLHFPYLIFHII